MHCQQKHWVSGKKDRQRLRKDRHCRDTGKKGSEWGKGMKVENLKMFLGKNEAEQKEEVNKWEKPRKVPTRVSPGLS